LKTAAPLVLLSLVVGGLGAGCGDSSGGYAGSGAGRIDGGDGAAAAGGADAKGDGAGGAAGASGGLVTGARVFSGTATMLFNGPSCTGEEGATGDRWCAFVTFTDATMLARSLYVVNVSRVAAGADVRCGAAGADCLLLTADLGLDIVGGPLHGTFFQGDTLVYYDRALVPYAWRPGMTSGRLLVAVAAGESAVLCTPASKGTAVLCLLLPPTQPDPNVGVADLLIGKADGASEPLLSVVDTVIVESVADTDFSRFGFGFPPGPGDHVAWTSRDGATGPETLKLQRAADPASKVTIASDVHAWLVSPDGSRWFWLSAIDGTTGVGTLQTAPFPSGANPTKVHDEVFDYGIVPPDGKTVVALTAGRALVAIADPITAAGELVLDTEVQTLLSLDAAGHVAYVKKHFNANLGDLSVKRADGTETCVAEPTNQVALRSVSFVPNAGAIMWARAKSNGFEAHYTRLWDCNTMPIAPDITLLASIGHERVLFMDQFDDVTVSGTLRFLPVGNGNTLSAETPIPIADHVDSYAITGPAPDTLLYTVNTGGDNDGVYIRWFAD
jgi:hypothetical protein